MATISLRNVGYVTSVPLFSNLTFTLGDTDRFGIVAGNGAGKSTLLRCLAGELEPNSGSITRARGARIALVTQALPSSLSTLTLHEAIRRAIPAAEREADTWRVDAVLDELAAPADLRQCAVQDLSGGWQRLALIARAWITEPDLLLLDEPTNHLDLEKIRQLEAWLARLRIPLVIASHDRRFLDVCTSHTLFLRPAQSRLFACAYSRARALLVDEDAAQRVQQEQDMQEVARLRRSANELRNVGINSRSDAAQKKSAQMFRRAERKEQGVSALHAERSATIRLSSRDTHARVLLTIEDARIDTPDGRELLRIPKLVVHRGDRIVLIGANGVGKSLLIHRIHLAMTGRPGGSLAPGSSGAQPGGMPARPADRSGSEGAEVPGFRASASVVVGYVDQHMSQLPERDTPIGLLTDRFRLGDQRIRSLLAGAGMPVDRQTQPIGRFSYGERARLGLLVLRLTDPNLYLLDEPTNHVDITGQEALEAELLRQEATCIVTSHDRYFARAIGTRFLLIDRGRLHELDPTDRRLSMVT
jgi:ATPase subunit of ABC transporter with duplicated ATPase domains